MNAPCLMYTFLIDYGNAVEISLFQQSICTYEILSKILVKCGLNGGRKREILWRPEDCEGCLSEAIIIFKPSLIN